jgi:hypothetical protein
MNIVGADEILQHAGFSPPRFRALIPNEDNYSVLLLQPRGELEADASGVRHRDGTLANRQFAAFLTTAKDDDVDLAITPEYSLPWSVLTDVIEAGNGPSEGALWCLGCASLRYADLEVIKHNFAAHATFIYEPLPPQGQRFANPLAYVFRTHAQQDGSSRLIVLVQFKTCPMGGDNDHFEINGMQRGTTIYSFGGTPQQVRLVSLICSDVLEFQDGHATQIYDRAIIIHIQLNRDPRHTLFKQYRSKLFRTDTDTTELLCLNWANDVTMIFGGAPTSWNNIAGSAWYLRPHGFDSRDPALIQNHQRGLYYTWCPSLRAHAMFLNFAPAVFHITATKVFHFDVAGVLCRRIGPRVTLMSGWDNATSAWVAQLPDDHFSSLLPACGAANTEVRAIAAINPFNVERVLALAAGQIDSNEEWHDVRKLDSCIILENETIRRITFCQDSEPEARQFRQSRISRLRRLCDEILTSPAQIPPSLGDFQAGKRFEWVPQAPHQNIIANSGKRATVIYVGEDASRVDAQNIKKRAADFLRRRSRDHDHELESKQRLAVWFRGDGGAIELLDREQYVKYDEPRTGPEFDIARTT